MMRVAWVAIFVGLGLACGGGGESGPGPLKYHLDEQYIAQVPLPEQQAMMAAQNEFFKAKAERMKAEADWHDSGTQLDVAKNQRKQAEIDEESASKVRSSAEDSGDQTRINAAMRDQRVAELGRRAAEKKVSSIEAQRSYLKKWERYTEENLYAKEARYELAKAKLAKDKNISPKGFRYDDFAKQAEDRSHRAQRARMSADEKKGEADAKQREWQASKAEADHAAGATPPMDGQGQSSSN
jgi:hypothetical protein